MKITNPDWHPESSSQLTVAQVRNLTKLFEGPVTVKRKGRQRMSMASLVRHGLATVSEFPEQGVNVYYPSEKAMEWKGKGYLQ